MESRMDVLSPLTELLLRSCLVLLPLTIGWLAFRRLALSKSGNAWIYAVTCLLAAVTVAGTLPWALRIADANWIFIALAMLCPALWLGVVLLCDTSRRMDYGPDPVADPLLSFRAARKPGLLILESPLEEAQPVFRHSKPHFNLPMAASKPSPTTRSLMNIARDIRGGKTSERRRPKLLPPPDGDKLPFLQKRG